MTKINESKCALEVEENESATFTFDITKETVIDLMCMSITPIWKGVPLSYPAAKVSLGTIEDPMNLSKVVPPVQNTLGHINLPHSVGAVEAGKTDLTVTPAESGKLPLRITGIVSCAECIQLERNA